MQSPNHDAARDLRRCLEDLPQFGLSHHAPDRAAWRAGTRTAAAAWLRYMAYVVRMVLPFIMGANP
jgi:hypothetical protein